MNTTIADYYPRLNLAIASRTYASCGTFEDAVDCFVQAVIPTTPDTFYTTYAYNLLYSSWFAGNTYDISSTVAPTYLNLGHDAIPSIGYTNFLDTIFDIASLNIKLNSVVNTIDYTNDNVMDQIRLIYPHAPTATQSQVTKWGQDPYALGAYSYPSTMTTYDDIVNLTLPVENKLFFAGEAINQLKDGTADAAYTSGFNAASAILQIMQ